MTSTRTSPIGATAVEDGFERILELLVSRHGLHARDYKQGTLRRRAERRMGLMGFGDLSQYATHLEHHPDELVVLYRDVLVGVTRFFRDPAQWEHIEREIVPRLLRAHGNDPAPSIRVWSAGCATGEEAYGLAIIFLEQLELRGSKARLQVFATDVNHEAVAFARRGIYPRSIAEDVPHHRLAQFFVERGEGYQIAPSVRERVTVSRHDLLSDPPFSRIDLVCCRNLLIYLEPHAQQECMRRFHFSLLPRGVLWLGNAESIDRYDTSFRPLVPEQGAYQRVEGDARAGLPWSIRIPSYDPPVQHSSVRLARGSAEQPSRRLTSAIEHFVLARKTAACLVVDEAGHVLHLFGPTARYLMPPRGEASPDLLAWVGHGLHARLRAAIAQAIERSKAVVVTGVHIRRGDQTIPISCTVEPVAVAQPGLWLVTFRDEDEPSLAADEAEPLSSKPVTHSEDPLVQWLTDELQETRAELRSVLDDFAGTKEEHQASYEELLSTNMALESTAAEAKALSGELIVVNREIEERNARLHAAIAELENLLAMTTVPTIFLDRRVCVRRFSAAAQGVVRLTNADVGRPLEDIEGRIGSEGLLEDARRVLVDLVPVETEVRCEDGRWYLRRVVPFRSGVHFDGLCITFADITPQKLAAERSEEARFYAESISRASRLPFMILDHELRVVSTNEVFHRAFGSGPTAGEAPPLCELGDGRWDVPELRELLQRVLREHKSAPDLELEQEVVGLGRLDLRLSASPMEIPGRRPLVLLSIEDVTKLRDAERTAERRARQLEEEQRHKDEFLAMLGHELRNPLGALANGVAILQATVDDPVKNRRVLPMLARQTARMTAMLDQLLDVSRAIAGKIELEREPVDPVEVTEAAVEAVRPAIEAAGHRLELSLPPGHTVFVQGDRMRLVQVVENLLSNAARYTDDGGTIWLTVTADEGSMRISVRDTGIGIDAALLERIFGVFTQGSQGLARSRGGLGLGLPLVRLLVTMHGGRVEASSDGPGRGSEFTIHLPRLHGVATEEPPGEPLAEPLAEPSARRVLVVDDEQDAARMLVELLRSQGHDASAVHSGRAALEAVRSSRPELVLLDLGLPDLDGYEVAMRLRAQHGDGPPLRLFALTGYQRDGMRLREAGFDEHLIKPLDHQRLAALVATYWPAEGRPQ